MVTASFSIPSPKTIEKSLGNFLEDIASSEAIVSILQKHAPKRRISQTESSLMVLMSLASRTRSKLNKIQIT